VWFDLGKHDEALKLAEITGKPLKIFIPEGCRIETKDYEFEAVECNHIDMGFDIWNQIDKDCINIISIFRFIIDPTTHSKAIKDIFTALIVKAHKYELQTPMTIFHDEFHDVVPNWHDKLDHEQWRAGAWIQKNIEKLRSLEVRMIVSTHGWRKIRPGIKSCFNWQIYKRISDNIGQDQKKMEKFVPLIQKLRNYQSIIVFPDKRFTDKAVTDFYGDAKKKVYYKGIYGDF